MTNVRVLKNRFSGDTGLASRLRYSHITGRMMEEEITETEGGLTENDTPF